MEDRKGNVMVPGKPGSGRGVTRQQVARVFLVKSDVSQIKALYSGEDGERLADAIRDNCNIWFPLKPEERGHDK